MAGDLGLLRLGFLGDQGLYLHFLLISMMILGVSSWHKFNYWSSVCIMARRERVDVFVFQR